MKQISDEQLRQVGKVALNEVFIEPETYNAHWVGVGRAALKACAEILLAEPTLQEINEILIERGDFCNDSVGPLWMTRDYSRVQNIFTSRLKSVLAEPDAAVEAVKGFLEQRFPDCVRGGTVGCVTNVAPEIVALVRSADKAGAK